MSDAKWALRMPSRLAMTASSLRLHQDVQALIAGEALWLRGTQCDDALDLALRKLPFEQRFAVSEDHQLFPLGYRLPVGPLPQGEWTSLDQLLVPKPQPSALSGERPEQVRLRLERSDLERTADVLVTGIQQWTQYAITAPALRLKRLRIAVACDRRALIRGAPLPPIPGERYSEDGGVAVPCGTRWIPPVDATIVLSLLGAEEGDLILLHGDETYEHIGGAEFQLATRSGARLMLARRDHER